MNLLFNIRPLDNTIMYKEPWDEEYIKLFEAAQLVYHENHGYYAQNPFKGRLDSSPSSSSSSTNSSTSSDDTNDPVNLNQGDNSLANDLSSIQFSFSVLETSDLMNSSVLPINQPNQATRTMQTQTFLSIPPVDAITVSILGKNTSIESNSRFIGPEETNVIADAPNNLDDTVTKKLNPTEDFAFPRYYSRPSGLIIVDADEEEGGKRSEESPRPTSYDLTSYKAIPESSTTTPRNLQSKPSPLFHDSPGLSPIPYASHRKPLESASRIEGTGSSSREARNKQPVHVHWAPDVSMSEHQPAPAHPLPKSLVGKVSAGSEEMLLEARRVLEDSFDSDGSADLHHEHKLHRDHEQEAGSLSDQSLRSFSMLQDPSFLTADEGDYDESPRLEQHVSAKAMSLWRRDLSPEPAVVDDDFQEVYNASTRAIDTAASSDPFGDTGAASEMIHSQDRFVEQRQRVVDRDGVPTVDVGTNTDPIAGVLSGSVFDTPLEGSKSRPQTASSRPSVAAYGPYRAYPSSSFVSPRSPAGRDDINREFGPSIVNGRSRPHTIDDNGEEDYADPVKTSEEYLRSLLTPDRAHYRLKYSRKYSAPLRQSYDSFFLRTEPDFFPPSARLEFTGNGIGSESARRRASRSPLTSSFWRNRLDKRFMTSVLGSPKSWDFHYES